MLSNSDFLMLLSQNSTDADALCELLTLSEEQRRTHPARWCLAEVCNVHSPAIEIEPIHRVVFGVGAKELYAALDAWDQQQGSSTTMSDQRLRLADATARVPVALANPPAPLTVGSVEAVSGGLPARPSRRDRGLHPRRKHGTGAGLRPGQTSHGHSAARLCEG